MTQRRRHGSGSLRERRGRWVSQGRHPVTGRLVSHTHPEGTSRAAAERLHLDWIAALRRRRADAAGLTVAGLCDLWLDAQVGIADATRNSQRTILRRVTSRIGHVPVAALDARVVDQLHADLWASYAPQTAATTRHTFASVCRRAVAWGALERTPYDLAAGAPRARPPRPAAPTTDEVARIVAAETAPHWRLCWRLMAGTGCRPGEALSIRWSDLDLDARTVTIRRTLTTGPDGRARVGDRTKSGRDRTVALGGDLVAALTDWQARNADPDGWVFPGVDRRRPLQKQSLDHAWRRATRRAGVAAVPPKGLRHWHASTLVAAGVPVSVVSDRLGHASMTLVMTLYGRHVPADADRSAAEALPDLAM